MALIPDRRAVQREPGESRSAAQTQRVDDPQAQQFDPYLLTLSWGSRTREHLFGTGSKRYRLYSDVISKVWTELLSNTQQESKQTEATLQECESV